MSGTPIDAPVRRGQTLIELILALIIVAVLGAAITRLLVWQSRFFDAQAQARAARSASRGGMKMLLSELRMIDATGSAAADSVGVDSLGTTAIKLRVPFAFGVLCQNAGVLSLALMPLDSLIYSGALQTASGGFTGYAWRDTGSTSATGRYHYVERSSLLGITAGSAAAQCAGAGITAVPNGSYAQIAVAIATGAGLVTPAVGTPVMLYQRVRYRFASSVAVPGTTALWRDIVRTGATEEITAPLNAAAQFRWFLKSNSGVATTTVPASLADVRGLELFLPGVSARAAQSAATRASAPVTTAVFFKNRLD